MSSAWVSIAFLVVALAMLPFGLKWLQRRVAGGVDAATTATRIVSAVGVGPHQRVVTVEVGPQDARVWLTLGVTAQSITCLHTIAVASSEPVAPGRAGGQLTTATVPESGQ
jgi:flagellar protein FliO/FliZ